jgi:hypothetical protein
VSIAGPSSPPEICPHNAHHSTGRGGTADPSCVAWTQRVPNVSNGLEVYAPCVRPATRVFRDPIGRDPTLYRQPDGPVDSTGASLLSRRMSARPESTQGGTTNSSLISGWLRSIKDTPQCALSGRVEKLLPSRGKPRVGVRRQLLEAHPPMRSF